MIISPCKYHGVWHLHGDVIDDMAVRNISLIGRGNDCGSILRGGDRDGVGCGSRIRRR